MDYTINNNLKKPLMTEGYNIEDFNDNSDIIDAAIGKISELTTIDKTNLVKAINELKADYASNVAKNYFSATRNPTLTDDESQGFEIGSIWVNATKKNIFQCVDSTTNSAVWKIVGYSDNLYNAGEEYEFLTGLWKEGYSINNGLQSKEVDHLYLQANGSDGQRTYVTSKLIDLSKINKLKIDWENTTTDYNIAYSHLVVSDVQMQTRLTNLANLQKYQAFSRQIGELDVSSLNGEYYIRVHSYAQAATGTEYSKLKIYRIWGE